MTLPERVVFWGRTDGLRLEHLPGRRVTRIVARASGILLAEVSGHPTAPETHRALARALRTASADVQCELEAFRPMAPASWRKGAA